MLTAGLNILMALAYLTFSINVHAVHFPPFLTHCLKYEGWNFNSGNYLFTTATK